MRRFALGFIASLAVAGAGILSAPAVLAADDDLTIDVILSLTGTAAQMGRAEQNALHTIEVRLNADGGIKGRPIHFAVSDDRSGAPRAAQLAAELVAKHAQIIIGSTLAASCNAMVPVVGTAALLYCLSPAIRPQPNGFAFSSSFSTRDAIATGVAYLRGRGLTRVASITASDGAGQEADRSIDEAFAAPENRTMLLAAREHLAPGAGDATQQIARLKASGAQAVIAWATGAQLGTILTSAREAELGVPMLTSSENLIHAQLKAYAGVLPSELLFPAGPSFGADDIQDTDTRLTVETFIAEFSQQGIRPDSGEVLAWDPAQLILTALKALGTNASAAQLRTWFANQRGWTGVNGSYNFRANPQRGLGPNGAVIVRWDPINDTWTAASKPGGRPI